MQLSQTGLNALLDHHPQCDALDTPSRQCNCDAIGEFIMPLPKPSPKPLQKPSCGTTTDPDMVITVHADPDEWVLTLKPLPDRVPAINRIRRLLKHAARDLRLRCVSITTREG